MVGMRGANCQMFYSTSDSSMVGLEEGRTLVGSADRWHMDKLVVGVEHTGSDRSNFPVV